MNESSIRCCKTNTNNICLTQSFCLKILLDLVYLFTICRKGPLVYSDHISTTADVSSPSLARHVTTLKLNFDEISREQNRCFVAVLGYVNIILYAINMCIFSSNLRLNILFCSMPISEISPHHNDCCEDCPCNLLNRSCFCMKM